MERSPFSVDSADGNEACCGACRGGGDLICCEGCPAAFHPECAGYASADEVPEGDWFCWFCSAERHRKYQHPRTHFKPPHPAAYIMVAVDDILDAFFRAKVASATDTHVEVTYVDVKRADERLPKASIRLWHGSATNKAAWTLDKDGVTWQPNARLFKVDREAVRALQQHKLASLTAGDEGDSDSSRGRKRGCGAAAAAAGGGGGRGTRSRPAKQTPPPPPAAAAAAASGGGRKASRAMTSLKEGLTRLVGARAGRSASPAGRGAAGRGDGSDDDNDEDDDDDEYGGGGRAARAGSAGATTPGSYVSPSAAHAAAAAAARGVQRVPAGEIGAGLPVIKGGAGRSAFEAALAAFWRRALKPGQRPPQQIAVNGIPVDPWHVWREVWSWGGPDACSKLKLWATVGFSFNPPATATSMSTRLMRFYDNMLGAFDEAIDAGQIKLERPPQCRTLADRALQLRIPTPSIGQGGVQAAAAAAAASSGGASSGGRGGGGSVRKQRNVPAVTSSGGKHQQQQQQAGRRRSGKHKRKRGTWSSGDEDDEPTGEPDESDSMLVDDSDPGGQHARQQQQQYGGGGAASSAPANKKLRITWGNKAGTRPSTADVLAAQPDGGRSARSGFDYLVHSSEALLMGRVKLTPIGAGIKVGDAVDFREPAASGEYVTGWRTGTVLATAPGSDWEGGRRLLIKPRHQQHQQQQQQRQQQTAPDAPTAAAMAALAAAGGPQSGAEAEEAAHKLLTPGGHLRHEVAALLPTRSGTAQAAGGGGGSASDDGGGSAPGPPEPVWLPIVWRGKATSPFPAPPLLVRPRYAPAATVVLPRPGLREQPRQVVLASGRTVEAQRDGAWLPCEVLSLRDDSAGDEACIVLRSLPAPEADGAVWRCSSAHRLRPLHPEYSSGCGVLHSERELEEPNTVAQLRKQLIPYAYAGSGITAFACLDQMIGSRRVAAG